MRSSLKSFLQTIFIPLALLLAVWVCLEHIVDSPLIMPGPAAVLVRAWQLLGTSAFRAKLGATLGRVLSAFIISVLLSLVLGSLQAFCPAVERALRIPLSFIKTAPVVSFILMALFWFTTGTVPVFVAVLMTLPVISTAVYKGITGTDEKLLAMCRVYGFTRWQTAIWCYVPSALPVVGASAVTAFSQTWKVVVAAEVISLPQKSLGTAMQTAKVHLETADVFAITLVLVAVSFVLETAFRALVSWRPQKQVPHDESVIPNSIRDPLQPDPRSSAFATSSPAGERRFERPVEGAGSHYPGASMSSAVLLDSPQDVTISHFTSVRGGRTVYRDFSHTFTAGTVTAILAPSGAGKTTLLDHIAGLDGLSGLGATGRERDHEPKPAVRQPGRGTYVTLAKNCHKPDGRKHLGATSTADTVRRVSYIFQEPRLLPALTVVQNVAAPLYRTLGKRAATERAMHLLTQVGLAHKADARVTELSGGEKQRVSLARAFAYPAPVLLMDEALQSQDVHLRLQLLELFEQLQQTRTTEPVEGPAAPAEATVIPEEMLNQVQHDRKASAQHDRPVEGPARQKTVPSRTVIMATHDIKEAVTLADTILVLQPAAGASDSNEPHCASGISSSTEIPASPKISASSETLSEEGISAPALSLTLSQDRTISARTRYLSGNAEIESQVLNALV